MSNFYCTAPWRGLHINPKGDVKTCCAGNPNMLGNLNTHRITEILNSNKLVEIRQSLSQGIAHEYCSNCVNSEKNGGTSERAWHNTVNNNFDYTQAGEEYHYPTIVDVRWNTTCNLSCNYCDVLCSSKWAALKQVPFKSGARPYYEQVCEFINEHCEYIHEVALVGGEPLLLPENNRLLDVIPTESIVTLITNLSLDLTNNHIFEKLKTRERVGWSMSFDNIGEKFEYVRHGASWQQLQENIQLIQDLKNNNQHWGGIHAVYNMYNATQLCEFVKFARDNNLTIVWQNLFQPNYLNPLTHGVEVAQLAIKEINKLYELNLATDQDKQHFDQLLISYQRITKPQPEQAEKFVQHITDIENKYHPDQLGKFAQLWPELASILWH